METPEFRNAKWTKSGSAIDCEINYESYGWIPFTCVQNDNGALFDTNELYDKLLASNPAQYVEHQFSNEQLAEIARQQRDTLLSETDWTQLPDVPQSTKTLWSSYRDALRNIPQQQGFPTEIIWPEKP